MNTRMIVGVNIDFKCKFSFRIGGSVTQKSGKSVIVLVSRCLADMRQQHPLFVGN